MKPYFRSKVDQARLSYEGLLKENGMSAVVPRSMKFLGIEDKEGNQLYRIVVMANQMDAYIQKARSEPFVLRKFVYDYEKYKADLHQKTVLETNYEQQKHHLAGRCFFAFSELFIFLMHLKVMRAFIDGVLRFNIPPRFYIGIIKANKGAEKQILSRLSETFADKAMAGMYGTKEETNDTEDFFPFVSIPLTSPVFLQ
jgi:V-type H+-transporting ATPase subunit C